MIIQDSHQGLDISPRYILFLSHFLSIPLLLILLAFFGINLFYLPFFTIFLPANLLTFFHFTSSYFLPFFFSFLRSSPLLFIHPSNHPPSCSASPYYILFFIHTSILSFFLLSFHPHMFLNSLPVLFFPFLSFIHHPALPLFLHFLHPLLPHSFTSFSLSHIYHFLFLLSFLQNSCGNMQKINSENPFQKVGEGATPASGCNLL